MSLAELLAECAVANFATDPDDRDPELWEGEAAWLVANRDRVLAALGGTEIENAVQFRRNACVAEYVNDGDRVWVFGATP